MTNYSNTIQAGVTILLIIAVGYICCKFNIIKQKEFGYFNLFLAKNCFFFLIFRSLAGKDIRDLDWRPFAISVLMTFSVYIVALPLLLFPFKDRLGTYIATVFPAVYINYVISGLPIFLSLWDESDISVITVILLSNDMLGSPVFFILTNIREIMMENRELEKAGKPKRKFSAKIFLEILLRLVQNMFLIGIAAGLIYSAFAWNVCTFLSQLQSLLGDCVLPFALFNVGAFLSQQSLFACHWLQFVFCAFLRLLVGPFFSLLFCLALKIPNKMARQCIVLTSQQTAVVCFTLTQNAKIGAGVSSTMILWSCVLMVPAIIFWLFILDKLNLFVD
ncbi:Auxin Efflux Carrier family protein [Tritrichomonas foetus]|uniref:Auxin Efflux Carrier family protein n=1 Tax=Tritrichomonas foetus TaxID=1144522 RepID=A0A1J4KTD1_9EUKA|nr:Auxin Efflux Carrier family protein [Tritrichomonas foetus]|eukprot:OHT13052.1 Auxin Efflux Carrier family protein [Tritrichomonas foetus]